ncbi:MAG: hypothetical protein MJB14_03315 [Spirochaetes bacterium]|nr:hypothetical protein [Spirochaetota bacterium]
MINPVLKKALIALIIFIILFYLVNAFFRILDKNSSITQYQEEIATLNKRIEKLLLDHEKMQQFDASYLETAYFDEEEYFENYIRGIFRKYRLTITNYFSKKTEAKSSEVTIKFNVFITDLFQLLDNLENGEKLIVIDNISLNKAHTPYVNVSITLKGYYQ